MGHVKGTDEIPRAADATPPGPVGTWAAPTDFLLGPSCGLALSLVQQQPLAEGLASTARPLHPPPMAALPSRPAALKAEPRERLRRPSCGA